MPKAWGQPSKESNPWRQPSKKGDQKPVEFRKATYDKKNILGGSSHSEGRAAGKESRRDKRK